ncbi:MAG: sulfite exporter TauE/SafE family protein [Myxococcales bacterium]|nr:sulfite exporter TauE/SafE family protein [Myxococcales bacterium]
MITDPVFYAVAIPAVLLVGISKGGFGGGVALLGVPMLALSIPLVQAAAILLPILCLMDLFALRAYRGQYDTANLRVLLPSALLGIAAGGLAFGALSETFIRAIVGGIAVAFSARWAVGVWRAGGGEAPVVPASPVRGLFWGASTGFASTIAHAGGPPLAVYLLPQRLSPTHYVGTTVILFTVVNYTKLVPYGLLGQLHGGNLATSLALAPLAPLGIALGRWLHDRVDERVFYRISYAMLAIVGSKLLLDAWRGIA